MWHSNQRKHRSLDRQNIKYTRGGLIGNADAIDSAFEWLAHYKANVSPGCLVIAGPCGVGKTRLWTTLCAVFGYSWLEISCMEHTKENVRHALRNHTGFAMTLDRRPVRCVLVVDDVDYLHANKHLFNETCAVLLESRLPRILVTSSLRSKGLRHFIAAASAKQFKTISLDPVPQDLIAQHLMTLPHAASALCVDIARQCFGDVRHAEIMLSTSTSKTFTSRMYKDRDGQNVEDTVRRVLYGPCLSLEQALSASHVDSMVAAVWGTNRIATPSYLAQMRNLSLDDTCSIADGFADRDVMRGDCIPFDDELHEYAVACSIWRASLTHKPMRLRWVVGADLLLGKRTRKLRATYRVAASQKLISEYFQ